MIEEISQPDKILDQASSDHITHIALKEIGDEKTFMVSASSDQTINLYYAKVSGSKAKASTKKSKTVAKTSQINLGVHEQMIAATLINETSLSVLHGSLFSMKRSQVKILDDEGKVQKVVSLSGEVSNIKELPKKPKAPNDKYQVMGIEDEGNARVNNMMNGGNIRQLIPQSLQLALLNESDDLASKLTSISSKNVKLSKSIGTVLS